MSGFAIHSERRKCKVASFAFGLSSGCALGAETRACGYRICVWCTLRPCRTQCGCAHRRESSSESESKKKSDYTHSLARLLLKRRGSVQSLSLALTLVTQCGEGREREESGRHWRRNGSAGCSAAVVKHRRRRRGRTPILSLSLTHSRLPFQSWRRGVETLSL